MKGIDLKYMCKNRIKKWKYFVKGCAYGCSISSYIRDYVSNNKACYFLNMFLVPIGFVRWLFPGCYEKGKGLAIVAIVKNEKNYLEEWIDFYQRQGVDKIILFDNDSSDDSYTVLQKYIKKNLVKVHVIHGKLRQCDAYNRAINLYKKIFKYMAFLDADEYLFSMDHPHDLKRACDEIFNKYPRMCGLCVNWLMYGSNGLKNKPEGYLHTNFTRRSRTDFYDNSHVKTICKPGGVLGFENPHTPELKKGWENLSEKGDKIVHARNERITVDNFRINHYFTKSAEEFEIKRMRGKADALNFRSVEEFDRYDRNEVYDFSINRVYED